MKLSSGIWKKGAKNSSVALFHRANDPKRILPRMQWHGHYTLVEKSRSRKEKWFILNHPALNSASLHSATLNLHHPLKLLSIRKSGCALENWAEVEWNIHLCHKVMGNQTLIFHLPPAKEKFCFQNVYKRHSFKLCFFLVVRNEFCMR